MRAIVIGAGKVGFETAKRLSEEDHDVVVIDREAEVLAELGSRLDVMTVEGSGASTAVLDQAGIAEARLVIAVTDIDEVNMIACMTAKQYGVATCVARIRNPDYLASNPRGLSLKQLGVDLAINPERLAALEITRLLKAPKASDVEYFAEGRITLLGLRVDERSPIVGRALADRPIPGFLIAALMRNGKMMIPRGETVIQADDRIFVIGRTGNFHSVRSIVGAPAKQIRSVAIVGASRISQRLIELIAPEKRSPLALTLIEKDEARAREAARAYPHVLVIEGDATKIDVLRDEGGSEFDAFVAVSGHDDTNLLTAMLAKELGIREVITEISREDYAPLAAKAGADAVVVPRLLTIGSVLRLVRQSGIVSMTVLEGGAEILEFVATEGCRITGVPLRESRFPRGGIIGAIVHDRQVVIPGGESVVQPGDRVIVFSLPESVEKVTRFFRDPYRTVRTLAPTPEHEFEP